MRRRGPRTTPRSCGGFEEWSPQVKLLHLSDLLEMRGRAGTSDGWRSYMCARTRVMRMCMCVFSVRLLQIMSPQVPAIEVNQ